MRELAIAIGVDLKIVTVPRSLRDLYEADLALIRPDQIVAARHRRAHSGPCWSVRSVGSVANSRALDATCSVTIPVGLRE
ncbi:conserved hypothetical protein [Bradyrhizobium sp. ORS 375]|uniref:hypothetical protein n=1 Tax=Bradyrhizobium sp. (strain ORS 375) TaxID=566679 RepID=UPI000240862D|nr:conserved hypothetical protein [Bradyrhizobium sp. ORS 375]